MTAGNLKQAKETDGKDYIEKKNITSYIHVCVCVGEREILCV